MLSVPSQLTGPGPRSDTLHCLAVMRPAWFMSDPYQPGSILDQTDSIRFRGSEMVSGFDANLSVACRSVDTPDKPCEHRIPAADDLAHFGVSFAQLTQRVGVDVFRPAGQTTMEEHLIPTV